MSKSAEGAELLTEQNSVHSNHGVTRMGMTRTCQHNARSHPQPKAPSDLPAAAASFALAFSSPPFPRLSNKSHYQHHLLPACLLPPLHAVAASTSTVILLLTAPRLLGCHYDTDLGGSVLCDCLRPFLLPGPAGPSRPVHIPPFIYL
ncbi:unnamed protein product [Musa acuminata subsp. burmannicoides]